MKTILIIALIIVLCLFVFSWFWNTKGGDLIFFYNKYQLDKYDDEFLESKLKNIASNKSTPLKDKKRAIRALELYLEDKTNKDSQLKVSSFISKYNINTDGDKIIIYNQLKDISENIDNSKEDIDFAKKMIKNLESKGLN